MIFWPEPVAASEDYEYVSEPGLVLARHIPRIIFKFYPRLPLAVVPRTLEAAVTNFSCGLALLSFDD
jgi:hypothetical protein